MFSALVSLTPHMLLWMLLNKELCISLSPVQGQCGEAPPAFQQSPAPVVLIVGLGGQRALNAVLLTC